MKSLHGIISKDNEEEVFSSSATSFIQIQNYENGVSAKELIQSFMKGHLAGCPNWGTI